MERVKIKVPEMEVRKVKFGDQEIEVKSKISLVEYEDIIEDIKEKIFSSNISDKYVMWNIRYIQLVLEKCTNIDYTALSAEELNSTELYSFLEENIDNFYKIKIYLQKEYENMIIENCFGIVASKMPSAEEMKKSMEAISQTINDLPADKLDLISKSIVWNQMPSLGNKIAPATAMKEA